MAYKKHKKKKQASPKKEVVENDAVSFKERLDDFYSRFKNPLKWKILTGLLAFALLLNVINMLSPKTEETTDSTDTVQISDDKTFEELNEFIDKMSIVTGTNDDKEAAITWMNDNTSTYQDTLHRSKKMLYLDLVSATRGNFTKEAAQYALENTEYNYKESAVYWANTLTTTGLSETEIKTELSVLQRYGGFSEDEIEYALNNITVTYSEEDDRQAWQYIEALSKDSYSNGSNKDKDSVSELVDAWLNESGYSQEQIIYNLTTYCNYDYDIVVDALLEYNVDWGLQAQRVLKRFANTDMSDESLTEFLEIVYGFPQGETKWAIKHR